MSELQPSQVYRHHNWSNGKTRGCYSRRIQRNSHTKSLILVEGEDAADQIGIFSKMPRITYTMSIEKTKIFESDKSRMMFGKWLALLDSGSMNLYISNKVDKNGEREFPNNLKLSNRAVTQTSSNFWQASHLFTKQSRVNQVIHSSHSCLYHTSIFVVVNRNLIIIILNTRPKEIHKRCHLDLLTKTTTLMDNFVVPLSTTIIQAAVSNNGPLVSWSRWRKAMLLLTNFIRFLERALSSCCNCQGTTNVWIANPPILIGRPSVTERWFVWDAVVAIVGLVSRWVCQC